MNLIRDPFHNQQKERHLLDHTENEYCFQVVKYMYIWCKCSLLINMCSNESLSIAFYIASKTKKHKDENSRYQREGNFSTAHYVWKAWANGTFFISSHTICTTDRKRFMRRKFTDHMTTRQTETPVFLWKKNIKKNCQVKFCSARSTPKQLKQGSWGIRNTTWEKD